MIALRNRQCDAARPFSFPSFHSGGALPITLMQLERVFEEAHKDAPRGAGQHRGAPSCRCPASPGPAARADSWVGSSHSDDEPPATNLVGPKRSHSAAFD